MNRKLVLALVGALIVGGGFGFGVSTLGGDPAAHTITVNSTQTATVTATTPTASTTISIATATDTTSSEDVPSIIVGKSIAGVKVGMTKSQVVHIVGPADSESSFTGGSGPETLLKWGPFTVHLGGASPQTVTQLDTMNPGDRTDMGVGPGSVDTLVDKYYPSASCDGAAGTIVCRVTGAKGIVTDFFEHGGKVTRVVIGFVD